MQAWFFNNIGLKILSLVIAALVWWLVRAHIQETGEARTSINLSNGALK